MNTKKILIIIGIIIILPIAWYLISPIFIVIERDDKLPFSTNNNENIVDNNSPEILEDVVDKIENNNISEDNTDKENIEEENKVVEEIEKKEEKVPEIITSHKGDFIAAEHEVKGEAKLILSGEDAVIRFENFDTINGPDLFIYLGADLKAKDFIDLGKIKGTKGNINYTVDSNIDFDKYKYVMVWCKPFSALFSYAELKKL
ncbi:MAG: DM13 domain-containing protein [Candidatus Gracilibacteria bacterium]|nr:DM13 domain-containing protein [Candidatus Gracilibacteria bacterium]